MCACTSRSTPSTWVRASAAPAGSVTARGLAHTVDWGMVMASSTPLRSKIVRQAVTSLVPLRWWQRRITLVALAVLPPITWIVVTIAKKLRRVNRERLHQLRVRTPEGVAFTFRIASPVLRAAATLIDLGVVMAAWSALGAVIHKHFPVDVIAGAETERRLPPEGVSARCVADIECRQDLGRRWGQPRGSAQDVARTCHGHPTLNEAVREAAKREAEAKRAALELLWPLAGEVDLTADPGLTDFAMRRARQFGMQCVVSDRALSRV